MASVAPWGGRVCLQGRPRPQRWHPGLPQTAEKVLESTCPEVSTVDTIIASLRAQPEVLQGHAADQVHDAGHAPGAPRRHITREMAAAVAVCLLDTPSDGHRQKLQVPTRLFPHLPTASEIIRNDADAAFYLKCRFLGRTSRWLTYGATVKLRQKLFRVLARFRRAGLAGEEVYTACILFFTCLGMGRRAHAIFDMALEDGIRPNSRMYNFLLGAYANEGNWTMTCQLWTQMVRNDILPTPHSFNILLRAQQRAGNKREVFELLMNMSDIMKPNSMTWTIMLAACTTYAEAMLVMKDMKRHDIHPDNRTVGAILDACVLCGDVDNAEQCTRTAEKEWGVPFTSGTYNVLMNVYKEAGDFEGLKLTFRRMQTAGCRADTLSYNLLVTSCALEHDVRTARQAFIEAEQLGISRTLHMNTAIMAVFGYCGDHEWTQRCWESRPGKGPSAKRTEPQLFNAREAYLASRLYAHRQVAWGLMAEMFRMRDPALLESANPYILQCLLSCSIWLRGWGVLPVWRMMRQVRTPRRALGSVDARRHQAVLHVSLDWMLATSCALWLKDHSALSDEARERMELAPLDPVQAPRHLGLLEEVWESAFRRGASMGARIFEPLLVAYCKLGLVERAKARFRRLLTGRANPRLMYPHAKMFRQMYRTSGDAEAAALCDSSITRYHNLRLWAQPAATVLQEMADDGVKPDEDTFAMVRDKQRVQQAKVRRANKEKEMIIRNAPGGSAEEDFLVGIVSDQLPFVSQRVNDIGPPERDDGRTDLLGYLRRLSREDPELPGTHGQLAAKDESMPLSAYLEALVDGKLDRFYYEELDERGAYVEEDVDAEAEEYQIVQ
eukprot:TRINITY_DN8005_c0_g1_i1.p1 TRINITY_DN8005_c0_g1~~TRINITY_DN8005_c0_g1_i1.p1  ORF type:complete len:838 (+),score=209.97 TRINITY_DN8005_c0_g1_i1:108-2621(+)